jgi:DNA-binding transcriptional ArsR family regulator
MLNNRECARVRISDWLAHGAGRISGYEVMRAAAVTAPARKIPAGNGDADADLKKLAKQAGDAAQLLKLLGNEKRLLILCFLAARGEMTVGELVGVVKLSQSALSQHLGKLRADGLVAFRRNSQTLHYRVTDKRALRVLGLLKEIYCGDLK